MAHGIRSSMAQIYQNPCKSTEPVYSIALAAPRPELLISGVPPLCLIFDPKPIIPLRVSLKKSKKRQAKTLLLKIRCTPMALAALAALAA